jgi:hypothetical protein
MLFIVGLLRLSQLRSSLMMEFFESIGVMMISCWLKSFLDMINVLFSRRYNLISYLPGNHLKGQEI